MTESLRRGSTAAEEGTSEAGHPLVSPRRLSAAEKLILAAEVLSAYRVVRGLLRGRDLRQTVAAVRSTKTRRARVLPDPVGDGLRLGNAVVRTLAPSQSASKCLTRSLVLLRLLARRGGDGELIIAVLPAGESPLDAHAWIEVNGDPLLVPAPDFGRLLSL